jgi:hypothetical protein
LHAKISCNEYLQKAGIAGFGAKTYASDPFSRVVTVYFPRAAAATPNKIRGLNVSGLRAQITEQEKWLIATPEKQWT